VRPGGLEGGQYLGSGTDTAAAIALAPMRFLRERMTTNRNTALSASLSLGMASQQQGAGIGSMLSTMSRFPGNVMGTPDELLSLFGAAPALGASYNFGGKAGGQGVRAAGLFAGVREAQMLNPGANVADLTSTIGGYAANTRSQQQSAYLTGGAMGMIKPGGGQKSLSEWAESVLRWLEGLRGGADRGKPFDYGQLMSQYFPGSNIDAWFDANGVPQNMRDYWWTYSLSKANKSGSTGGGAMKITPDSKNLAQNRLQSTTELTRTEFGLAGSMMGAYQNREDANRWFNQMFGQMQTTLIPAFAKSLGAFIQFLPDTIEEMLAKATEMGVGGIFGGLGNAFKGGGGDVGDIGDYTTTGGTSTSGMHPDMRRKLGGMLRANPKLSITSGLRDENMQGNLKRKGYSRVSGKSSAHTRGMAADLGPPSQYAWIVANAGKFGLSSGNSQGEPWHVGMGDALSDLAGGLTGGFLSDPESAATLIAQLMGNIFGKMQGGSGSSGGVTDGPAYDPSFYERLVNASNNIKSGLPSGPGVRAISSAQGNTLGQSMTPGGSSNSTGAYTGVRTPSNMMGSFFSADDMTRGEAVAQALYAAGFRGQDLINMTSISFRESRWNPNAWNGSGQDRSGGLLQINQKPWLDKGQTPPFSTSDLLDPYANAQIAYDMFTRKIPGQGGYSPWDYPGDPSWQYKVDFGKGSAAVHAAGLGDAEFMSMLPSRTSGGGGLVQFHNVFQIGGGGNGAGAGGIDVRRTVNMIADQLETEMTRRVSRVN
jgi:hypothetical protein